jgi:hypothetical protein
MLLGTTLPEHFEIYEIPKPLTKKQKRGKERLKKREALSSLIVSRT